MRGLTSSSSSVRRGVGRCGAYGRDNERAGEGYRNSGISGMYAIRDSLEPLDESELCDAALPTSSLGRFPRAMALG